MHIEGEACGNISMYGFIAVQSYGSLEFGRFYKIFRMKNW